MGKKFQRKIEDFICDNCGAMVAGDGYTNHCPRCLFSKDVDVNPGDRASECGGMMEPFSAELRRGEIIIAHKCRKCGKIRKNKSAKNDDFDEILKIMKKPR